MKKFVGVIILALILVLGLPSMSSVALADEPEDPGLEVVKEVNVQDDGTYVVDLEAFATGSVTFNNVPVPVDLILVLDVSGSMAWDLNKYTYTARTRQGYTYDGYGNSQYYYKHSDGNYYRVYRDREWNGSSSRVRLLYFDVNGTRYYLSGTGATTTMPTSPTNNNSTIWTGVLYTRAIESSQSRISALQDAVNGFIDVVAAKNKEIIDLDPENTKDADLSRVAIVKFAGNSRNGTYYSQYKNNIGNEKYNESGNSYNYTQVVRDLTAVKTADLTSGSINWHNSVNSLTAAGATCADYGMEYANAIYTAHKSDYTDRNTVVVMFTDGEPTRASSWQDAVARSTVNASKVMKANEDVKVFTVAIYDQANPADDPGSLNINQYLHAVSSNYRTATPDDTGWDITWGERAKDDKGKKLEYYYAAESSDELSNIFTAIAQASASTGSKVGAQSVMKDIVSSSFALPEGADVSTIEVSIVPWDSTTHNWSETVKYTTDQWKTACRNYGAAADAEENVAVTISEDGKTVDISGFDYATHFQAAKTSDDDHDGANAQTAKLVVSFPIIANPNAITGSSVATNGAASGIYLNADDEEAVIYFPVPEVVFTPVTYVVDYVTSDTSKDTKASSVVLDYSKVLKNVEMLDKPGDDYLIGQEKVDFDYVIYKGKYGTISFGDDELDVERRYVRYAPTTMNWNGYDRIFIKGESASENNKDVWAMLAVLPANSVFYEDTYISQTKTVEYNEQSVDIVYTGINYSGTWDMIGAEGTNQTYHAGDNMGWVSGLADDNDYANDMAHTSSTAKSKATFTFSGTGVDIYSRTNGSTGTISVNVKSAADKNDSGQKVNKSKLIDTKSAAGDFFAVPVCTFTDLPYGEYTVTIGVTTGGQKEGRMTFYLDGVRVYNPIKPLEGDENVQMMYGAKNMGAEFKEVRSMLGTDATSEALYIDEYTTSEIVTDLDAINAAANALAQAQQARDAYVENTVTPAKNAVSDETYALSKATTDLENATKVYNAAVEAYNAAVASENAEAIAKAEDAMNEKLADKNAKQTAYNNAVAHYEANIDGLQEALAEAFAGREPYNAAVKDAIAAYDLANDGVTVSYTEAVVADYDKEGPKSELYLSKGQQVVINVEAGNTYYIGLRSLKGDEVTAQINGATVTYKIKNVDNTETVYSTIAHTVDMYYEAVPEAGKIVIKNASDGEGILAITKLRITDGGNTTSSTTSGSTEDALTFVRSLANRPAAEYTGKVLTEEEAAGAVLDVEDIAIENMEAAEVPAENETALSKILSSFFRFFSRQ